MNFEIRDATPADLPAVLAMNEAAVPYVNSLDLARMKGLHEQAAWFRVAAAQPGDGLAAFLIGLTPDAKAIDDGQKEVAMMVKQLTR